MSKEHDVIVYMRNIKLDVVIPKKWGWSFMNQFGKKFAVKNHFSGEKEIKSVDGYSKHLNGWHIHITIRENEEKKFYEFLQKFCNRRKISFRDPREYSEYQEVRALNKRMEELSALIEADKQKKSE